MTYVNLTVSKGLDAWINNLVQPLTDAVSSFIFFSVPVMGADLPLIVLWLILAASFFTLYLGFINLRGFKHALDLVRGKFADSHHTGEITHFQALTAAVSGTVGIGNIGAVAVTVSVGGPGAIFWVVLAGFLGMTTKFVECTLGVKYRTLNADGTVSGGPMYYLRDGLAAKGMAGFGKFLGLFFAASIVIGCLGIGNMFQSNQAYVQLLEVTGGQEKSPLIGYGWAVGLLMAILVALIIIGGIKSIAKITAKLVPFMIVIYIIGAVIVLVMNAAQLPGAITAILTGAFSMQGAAGGMLGAMIIGFQRAVFSNEAGLGSASIAHSAVKTESPLTEGFVARQCRFLLLPFFLRSQAYYGTKGWTYIFGEGKGKELTFSLIFCLFIIIGASVQLSAILDFADALIFVMAIPNLIGLYILAPEVKRDLKVYLAKQKAISK